jgi:DNA-binding transcriptional ArsR family regulator
MGSKASKIDRAGLAPVILELQSAGITTSIAISAALKEQGFNISQPTVSRWLKAHKDLGRDDTRQIVQDHIKAAVPADLDALENMEAACLAWAKEDEESFSERIANQRIKDAIPEWKETIANTPADRVGETVADIIRKCLHWIAQDVGLQKRRLAAMKQATSIIELKLRYSGIIDAAGSGNIIMVDSRKDRVVQDEHSGRLMVIKGGKDQDAEGSGL